MLFAKRVKKNGVYPNCSRDAFVQYKRNLHFYFDVAKTNCFEFIRFTKYIL